MQILSLLQKYTNCSDLKLFSSTSAISFHGFPFPKSCLEKSQHFQHSKVKLCPQKRHCFFFSLLNKSKYLREWVSLKDLSKSRRGMKTLCFPQFFLKKKFPVFKCIILPWLRLNLHLKQLSCFEQIWIGFDSPEILWRK